MRIVRCRRGDTRESAVPRGDHLEVMRIDGRASEPWEVAAAVLAERRPDVVDVVAATDVELCSPVAPTVVLSADDAFATQAAPRRTGLALQRPPVLEQFRRRDPAEDIWLLPRVPASVSSAGIVLRPDGCERLDAGVCLAAVVGESGPVAWCVALDVVRRDVPVEQACLARSYATHTPIGEELVTADELGPLDALALTLDVAGERRQAASVADMVVSPETLLGSIGRRYQMPPGSLVLFGTPPGTAHDRGEGWLRDGDDVVARVGSSVDLRCVVAPEGH